LIEIIIKNGIAPPLQSCQLTPSKLDTCTFVTVLKSEHLKPIKKFYENSKVQQQKKKLSYTILTIHFIGFRNCLICDEFI
jgi:hypothetical protein